MRIKLPILALLLSLVIVSCGDDETKSVNKDDISIFTNFVRDVKTLKKYKRHDAFKRLKEIASNEASKRILLSKSSVKSFLREAEDYKYCIIFVADHTVVKVNDFSDCKKSGSWGVCMPKGEGYIIKGKWNYKKDYINNIIGRADRQKRMVYLYK
jgi:hypothetical protein